MNGVKFYQTVSRADIDLPKYINIRNETITDMGILNRLNSSRPGETILYLDPVMVQFDHEGDYQFTVSVDGIETGVSRKLSVTP